MTNSSQCMRVLWHLFRPYVMYNNNSESNGVYFEILDATVKKYKLCYTLTKSSDPRWLLKYPNGTYVGNIALLKEKLFDVFIPPTSTSIDAFQVAELSDFVQYDTRNILFKYPTSDPDPAAFLKPFSIGAWILLLLGFLGLGILFSVMISLANFSERYAGETPRSRKWYDIFDVEGLYWIIYGITEQSLTLDKQWKRMMISSWLLVSFIFSAMYQANLLALITTPQLALPFDSVQDATTSKSFNIYYHQGGGLSELITNAQSEEGNVFYNLKRYGLVVNTYKYVWPTKLEKEENRGLLLPDYTVLDIINADFRKEGYCRVALRKDITVFAMYNAITLPWNSTYTKYFNRVIRGFRDGGLVDYRMRMNLRNATHCYVSKRIEIKDQIRVLTTIDFVGVFYLYASGLSVAILVFLVEVLVHRFYHKTPN